MSADEHAHSPFAIVPWEVAADKRLTQRHLRVLIALLSFRRRDTGLFFATRAQIAERCGLPETRISNATTELEALGWLVKHGAGRVAVRYEFKVPETITETVTVTNPVTVTKPVTVKPSTVTKTVTQPLPNRSHSDNHTESHIRKTNTRADTGPDERFAEFWSAYPVNKAKQAALKAWRKIKPDGALLQVMLHAIEAQKLEKATLQAAGKFVPEWKYPATWLNAGCWEDSTDPGSIETAEGADPIAEAQLRRLGGAA